MAPSPPVSVRYTRLRRSRRASAAIVGILATLLSTQTALAGDGSFATESGGSPVDTGAYPQSLAIGDFNNDGNQDLAIANSGASTITVRLGAGTGGFPTQPAGSPYATGGSPYSIATGDFNNDGNQDLATANKDSDNVTIRLGAGDGTFPNPLSSTLSGGGGADAPVSVVVGHFNADSNLDLAVANRDSDTITVFLGAGDGSFPTEAAGSEFGTGANTEPYSMAVGDFNSDGRDDLAVGYRDSAQVGVHLGTAMFNAFEAPVVYAVGDSPYSVAVGDFNSDGDEDLAVADHDSPGVTVRLGAGDGSFAAQAPGSPLGAGSQPGSIAVGDFNSDGDEDLAVTNESVDQVTVRLGAGDGTFPTQSAGSPFATGATPYFAAVGEFNSDANEDLAVVNNGGASVTVRLGGGAPLLAGNLLANGGAEGAGAGLGWGDFPSIPAWTPGAGAMTFIRYSAPGGFPRGGYPGLIDSGRWEGGLNLFAAGNDDAASALTSASQTVDVTAAAGPIDAGLATASIQADLGGFRVTNDTMQVGASFRDAAGAALGSIEIGPVNAAERKNLTTLLRRAASAPVPAGTSSIVVTLTATRPSGTFNHAYADNIRLTLDLPDDAADTVPPELVLSGKKVQKLGTFVTVGTRCESEGCHVRATGVLAISKKHGRSTLKRPKLRKAEADLLAGKPKKLKLKIRPKPRRAALAALENGARVKAKLTVTASDAAGNVTVRKRAVRLR